MEDHDGRFSVSKPRICKSRLSDRLRASRYYWEHRDRMRAAQHRYYERNKKRIKAQVRKWQVLHWDQVKLRLRSYHPQWRRRNIERRLEVEQQYRHQNKERLRLIRMKYVGKHAERLRSETRQRYWRNPDQHRQRSREYYRKHPEEYRAWRAIRRAREAGALGKIGPADIRAMLRNQKGKCFYCRVILNRRFHLDHKMPLVRGGTNKIENLCCACQKCNLSKHTLNADEWIIRRQTFAV